MLVQLTAHLLAPGLGDTRDRAGLQRRDMLAQSGGGRDAEYVAQPLGAPEAQHLGRAVTAFGAQQDLDVASCHGWR